MRFRKVSGSQDRPVLSAWLAVSVFALVLLSACASANRGQAGPGNSDLVTDSDEPEDRKRARLRLELAMAYFEKGQNTDALDHLKQSIAADSSLYEAYNLRGLIYMRLADPALAEDSFKRSLSINPKAGSVQHNYGWLLCQQGRLSEAVQSFTAALANPSYGDRAKTWMTLGLCQQRGGQMQEAEQSLHRAYELDAGNPITGYNLALVLYQRGEFTKAQFYVRRINNSELANAESLWLGIRVERRLNNREAMAQLGAQLKKRFFQSAQHAAYERGDFHD